MTVFIASDHAGFELKQKLLKSFSSFVDLGPASDERVDYPDFADLVCRKLTSEITLGQSLRSAQAASPRGGAKGVLICGSGQGMAIRANRYPEIRAALVWNEESTRLACQHNHANVLCLGGRLLDHDLCAQLVQIFLSTHPEGGRHELRVEKLKRPIGD